jgi:hypothetical protein
MDRRSFLTVASLFALPAAGSATFDDAAAQDGPKKLNPSDRALLNSLNFRYAPQFDIVRGKPNNIIDFYWSPGCRYSMLALVTVIGRLFKIENVVKTSVFRFTAIARTRDEIFLVADLLQLQPKSFGPACIQIFIEAMNNKPSGLLTYQEIGDIIRRYPIDRLANRDLCEVCAAAASQYYVQTLGEAHTPGLYVNGKRVLFNPALPSVSNVLDKLV